jgi:soluble lytic murein transglycosylase-like protein
MQYPPGVKELSRKAALAVLSLLVLAGVAHASPKKRRPSIKQTTADITAPSQQQFRQDFIDSTKQYQASLQAAAASYSRELDALTARNATLKDLFNKGLISRVDMEKSDKDVAEARSKIDEIQKEKASADGVLSAAMNPAAAGTTTGIVGTSTDWTTGNKKIDQLIRHYGKVYSVDPYLIYLVMHQESGFSATAVSAKGARGLMQLMPATAARYGVTNPADPAQNIMGGAHYLSDLLKLFDGNVNLALAGYNAGEGAVMKYGNQVPPYQETRYYVRNISAKYKHRG